MSWNTCASWPLVSSGTRRRLGAGRSAASAAAASASASSSCSTRARRRRRASSIASMVSIGPPRSGTHLRRPIRSPIGFVASSGRGRGSAGVAHRGAGPDRALGGCRARRRPAASPGRARAAARQVAGDDRRGRRAWREEGLVGAVDEASIGSSAVGVGDADRDAHAGDAEPAEIERRGRPGGRAPPPRPRPRGRGCGAGRRTPRRRSGPARPGRARPR